MPEDSKIISSKDIQKGDLIALFDKKDPGKGLIVSGVADFQSDNYKRWYTKDGSHLIIDGMLSFKCPLGEWSFVNRHTMHITHFIPVNIHQAEHVCQRIVKDG